MLSQGCSFDIICKLFSGNNHVYFCFQCDIWAVGVTAIELAELQPPMFDLHPMRYGKPFNTCVFYYKGAIQIWKDLIFQNLDLCISKFCRKGAFQRYFTLVVLFKSSCYISKDIVQCYVYIVGIVPNFMALLYSEFHA